MTTGSLGHRSWTSAAALFSEPTDWKNPHVPPLANEKTERDTPARWAGAWPPQGAMLPRAESQKQHAGGVKESRHERTAGCMYDSRRSRRGMTEAGRGAQGRG